MQLIGAEKQVRSYQKARKYKKGSVAKNLALLQNQQKPSQLGK
jgi:hypothetical protein